VFSQLATPQGTVSFPVFVGHIFGFRVETQDNTGGRGVPVISDFSATQVVSATPEPGCALGLLLLGGIALARKGLRGCSCRADKELA
jgi:hypothetical protein